MRLNANSPARAASMPISAAATDARRTFLFRGKNGVSCQNRIVRSTGRGVPRMRPEQCLVAHLPRLGPGDWQILLRS